MLAYNCSPSFNWKKKLDDAGIAKFQRELGAMGYKFQFITLAGFHALNLSMFELARAYKRNGMTAYSRLQEKEFSRERQLRLCRRQAPALRGHRLLRRGHAGDRRRSLFDHRPERLYRRGAVHARRLPGPGGARHPACTPVLASRGLRPRSRQKQSRVPGAQLSRLSPQRTPRRHLPGTQRNPVRAPVSAFSGHLRPDFSLARTMRRGLFLPFEAWQPPPLPAGRAMKSAINSHSCTCATFFPIRPSTRP